ncbi:conserved hypothetical integral membrane protein [Nakamurella panacisegetis]|uniref:Conserved hypothetical integral membrane protein n=1 Tax=Nakamurella panacisegetis TaxID=1090615 RepID=A0A1H0RIH4_9ACTN|nr:conserved hypothetical integral membrane protein [Nakamurella panacisegetis]
MSVRGFVPGVLATAAATACAYAVAALVPALNPTSVAVLLGALVTNVGLNRPFLRLGTQLAARHFLRVAVVLLGLQLSVPQLLHLGGLGLAVVVVTVGLTFTGTRLLGRWFGVPPARSLLIATGFSICGASAVAAMEPVADGDEQDTSTAIALVTLCGSLAIVALPLLRQPLGLDAASFGSWVGASVHDIGQTVATADRVPGALTAAVVVKLTRVILLAPMVAGVALVRRHRSPDTARARIRPPVPLFVAGFLLAVAIASLNAVSPATLSVAKDVQGTLLVAALFALGTGIHLPTLLRTGGRSLALALTSWVLIAGVAYAGVRLAGL